MALDYVWDGAPPKAVPFFPATGLDNAGNIFYVSSKTKGWIAVGGGPVGAQVVQATLQQINTTTPQSISITALADTLYSISIYMKAIGTAGAGHKVTATIFYTAPDDLSAQSVALILPLYIENVVMETYPLFVAGGTPITLTTVYGGGATNDPYTISVRMVEMP